MTKNLYSGDEETMSLITEWQKNTVAVAESLILHQREDYKEFTELCLLYLDSTERSFKFHRPGAVHKARWMGKILYAVKMVLLEKLTGLWRSFFLDSVVSIFARCAHVYSKISRCRSFP